MTLLDVKNHLYGHFLQKTTFSMKDDLESVRLGSVYDEPKGEMAQYKTPLVRAALEDMTKTGLLLVLDQVNGVYMLTTPLVSFNQQVVISPYTANLIADAFNFFALTTSATPYRANKFAITDTEVNAIAQMAFAFRDEADELHDMMMGGDDGDGPEMPGPMVNPESN